MRLRLPIGAAALALCAAAACSLPATSYGSVSRVSPNAPLVGAGIPHQMGLVTMPHAAPSAAVAAQIRAAAASPPASVDLTADAMPVGNQGDVGSCAAWATDYTALGYWENREGLAGGGLEPMYTYSQLSGGVDDGSTIEGNLSIDMQQGVDDQADYWQGNFDYIDMPSSSERANAVNWKLTSYNDLPTQPSNSSNVTQQSIETALAAGTPVVIGIPVYLNFEYVTGANQGLYTAPSGQFLGDHAITALGYNSTGLVIENSWGTSWGDGGYATLSWSFVNGYVFDAVAVGPLVSGQPVDTSPPRITGNAGQGQTLAASSGTWNPAASSYAYQWQRATGASGTWSAISGATAATYVPVGADVGDSLRVVVTASSSHGRGIATSAEVGPVASGAPSNTVPPNVTGAVREGQLLTASSGTWSPAATSYTYQWQRSTSGGSTWSVITGATQPSYAPAAADVGAYLRVLVTAINSYGQGTAASTQVGVVSGPPYNILAPTVTGAVRQSQTLSAHPGTWSPVATSYAYQWQRQVGGQWANITGMTGSTYVLESSDVGTEVRVQITAINGYGYGYAWSAAAGPVLPGPPIDVTAPVVAGTATRGSALKASQGTWNPPGTSYSYQWQRSMNAGGTWAIITGATGSSYTLVTADENAEIRVAVTAVNPYGEATAPSAATKPVKASPPTTTSAATVRIAGATTVTNRGWPVASRRRPLRTAGTAAR